MSTAVAFLLVALAAAAAGSAVIWALQHRPRRQPDFQEQLRALAPRPGVTEQPTGIVPLDPSRDEER